MTREEQIVEASKKFSEYEYNQTNFENGFINGAKWADKNPVNVWHDASEIPQAGIEVIIQFGQKMYDRWHLTFNLPQYDEVKWKEWCNRQEIIRWAYISDL